ncbi:MAG TPA: hypothetical protein VI231_04775 [Candidatus Binatia bacterium]|jgi:hypothetical protein
MSKNHRGGLKTRPYFYALTIASVTAIAAISFAQQPPIPKEFLAVQRYILEKDYPEVFGETRYRTKIENAVIADLDGDGLPEVTVHTTPHYRQSAPIVIFRVDKDLNVTRVKEGLAPGPLVPLTGEYLDSHIIGMGVDFVIGLKPGEEHLVRSFAEKGVATFGGFVQYKNFHHADGRKGSSAYIDMTHIDVPAGKDSCADFEFARVIQITVGKLDSESGGNYLAAHVSSEIWLYRIEEFLPNGLLKKTIRVEKVPGDFVEFMPLSDGLIRYRSRGGEIKQLSFARR